MKEKFIKKYDGKGIVDCYYENSKEFIGYVKDFKNALQNELIKGATVCNFLINHYGFSGFIEYKGHYFYFVHNVPRGEEPIDFDNRFECGVVLRKTENEHDYTGGLNYIMTVKNFFENVNRFIYEGSN